MNAAPLSYDEAITLAELTRLGELEQVVETGLTMFVKVGNALLEIRDSRLYRQQFATFEAYCKERWRLKERHAYKLMDAASVVENLQSCPIGQLPQTESQARPLTRLEPEVQREVWKEVVETTPTEQITAKVVEEKAKAAEPLNEAVKAIKEELKPDPPPPAQQPMLPEPAKPLPPVVAAVTEKVKAGEMTVLQAAKAIENDQQATFIQELRQRQRQAAPPKPTPRDPTPIDPVFETVLPNGRNIAKGDPKALWLWGWLLECEDRFLGTAPDPKTLAGNFLDFMQDDSQRLIPKITHYLHQLREALHETVS